MKKLVKTMVIMTVLAALLVPTMVSAKASADVTVKVDGQTVKFPDAEPYIESNRVLIPVRFVSEALGGKVDYSLDKTVSIQQGDKKISLKINSKVVTANEQKITLDVPARVKQQRTFVPLRFVSEVLGATVDYKDRVVTITTASAQTSVPVEEAQEGFQVDPQYNALAPLVFKNNVRIEGDELVFTMPELQGRTLGRYSPWGGEDIVFKAGQEYRFKLGANATVSIAYAHADEQIEGYMFFLDPKYKSLEGEFDSVTGDVIVASMNTSIPVSKATLSDVLENYK